jgi:putative transposase
MTSSDRCSWGVTPRNYSGDRKEAIFRDNADKDHFVKRIGNILLDTSTPCYAWALMLNRVHLL